MPSAPSRAGDQDQWVTGCYDIGVMHLRESRCVSQWSLQTRITAPGRGRLSEGEDPKPDPKRRAAVWLRVMGSPSRNSAKTIPNILPHLDAPWLWPSP